MGLVGGSLLPPQPWPRWFDYRVRYTSFGGVPKRNSLYIGGSGIDKAEKPSICSCSPGFGLSRIPPRCLEVSPTDAQVWACEVSND